MSLHHLYTIGHGTRPAEEFLALLREFQIQFLLDVRSHPYSRFHPQYNQKQLKNLLQEHGITYVFMGDTLGGRPTDPACYDTAGKLDYRLLKQNEYFRQGLKRLRLALEQKLELTLMCSERKPADCHRSKLIGEVLALEGYPIRHIDEKGELRDQQQVSKKWTEGTTGTLPF